MDIVEILRELIRHKSVSKESNLEIIYFIIKFLDHYGIESNLIYNKDRTKANLWATIGPHCSGGIILSGHTDVVPVAGQEWSSSPFKLRVCDNRLYGRGTTDMKGFIASVLASIPAFVKSNLRKPIHLCFSYDEEVGCQGVVSAINFIRSLPYIPGGCIVGEPTSLKPIIAHKGKLGVECRVNGLSCHSSVGLLQGVNAISYASKLITKLDAIAHDLANQEQDDRFSPNVSTIQTGIIHGGQALNIVPNTCTFNWEVRSIPNYDPKKIKLAIERYAYNKLEPKMHKISSDTSIVFTTQISYPGLSVSPQSLAAETAAAITQKSEFGSASFGCEAGRFQEAGIPAVVCGPGDMSRGRGHKADEFIEREQLQKSMNMLSRLAESLSS